MQSLPAGGGGATFGMPGGVGGSALGGLGGGAGLRPPDANTEWFLFMPQGGPANDFAVYAFSGREEINKPYAFTIELVSRSSSVDIAAFLGVSACLSIADKSGEKRLVHGLISEMEQLHTANRFTTYSCTLVPRLAFLDQIRDHRIFQNLTVPDIIKQILKEQGFSDEAVDFRAGQKFPVREYCVQYGESDLHFIQRLCEEESIFFYHTHKEDGHCLCFYDYKGGPNIAGAPDLRFYPGSGQPADTAVISYLRLRHKVNSNAAMYKEWNFQKPHLDLTVADQETEPKNGPAPEGMLLEQYQYPHIYDLRDPGTRYAKMQLERQLTFRQWIECESDVSRFLPGHVFGIYEHPRPDINAQWFITEVRHNGEQPGVLEHEAPDGRGLRYDSRVVAIPKDTRYVPQLEHPKQRVIGTQTAIVTGPDGEEIYPDKYGRVKVQFFWDREGKWDEKTTCWIRVSQGWAGSRYGTMAIPRIGHEVIVSFLEGDPDRPLITGRVYHAINMPPYGLPDNKTRTVFKSMSSPGKEGEPRGFNELRIEDKTGEEEIYLHGQKDVNTYIKNDWKDWIGRDSHLTVENFTFAHTKGETHETLDGHRKTKLGANDNLTVAGDAHIETGGSWLCKSGAGFHVKAGEIVALQAGAEIILKAGGSFIRIGPEGITTQGAKTSLNSGGGCGNATVASPLLPENSTPTDAGICPTCIADLLAAEKTDTPFTGSCS